MYIFTWRWKWKWIWEKAKKCSVHSFTSTHPHNVNVPVFNLIFTLLSILFIYSHLWMAHKVLLPKQNDSSLEENIEKKKRKYIFEGLPEKAFLSKWIIISNQKGSVLCCVCVRAPTEFLPKYWTAYYCCSLLWFRIERFDVSLMLLHPVYIHSSYLINLFSPAAAFIYLFSPFFPSLSFRFISSICQ